MSAKQSEAPVLPELEQMLTEAGARNVRRAPLGGRIRIPVGRIPRLVGVAAACLAIGGSAMAATGVWNPPLGNSSHPKTASDSPVPPALVEELGVLRREQTPQDRSAEVEATLRGGGLPEGVRLESVRFLAPGEYGEATVLLSGVAAKPFETEEEPVCVARPFPEGEPAYSLCFGLSQLQSGGAHATYVGPDQDGVAFGIVPDGVATITAEFASAPPVTVPVQNNYWELPVSGAELSNANGESSVQRTVWRDAAGNVIPQAEPAG
jgi:hypothetical protein